MFDADAIYPVTGLALMVTLMFIAIAYAAGKFFRNPRFEVWSKVEIYQVFITVFLVIVIAWGADFVGGEHAFQYGELRLLAPTFTEYEHPPITDTDSIRTTSTKYIDNMLFYAGEQLEASRNIYGSGERENRYQRSYCQPQIFLCLFGSNGFNMRATGGASAWLQVANLTMYTDIVSYITLLVQKNLLAFIFLGGGLGLYLPIAIILRSLPFLRPLGGGLIAICVSLFLVFPMLLFIESIFWNPADMLSESEWEEVFSTGPNQEVSEDEFDAVPTTKPSGSEYPYVEKFRYILKGAAAMFISSSFLFTLNILAVAASAREFGRLLGQEVEMTRLLQVV